MIESMGGQPYENSPAKDNLNGSAIKEISFGEKLTVGLPLYKDGILIVKEFEEESNPVRASMKDLEGRDIELDKGLVRQC